MEKEPSAGTAWSVLAVMLVGYMGVYLCRVNLSVAVPMLQDTFHASKAEVGRIAAVSTAAYAAGKLLNGTLVDRIGGRLGFLIALLAVAAFTAMGALGPGLAALTLFYSLNRYAGSAGWMSMVKLVPSWFRPARVPTAISMLSLSFVFGPAVAKGLAELVMRQGGGWRAVMGVPALVLLALALLCALMVRRGPLHFEQNPTGAAEDPTGEDSIRRWDAVVALIRRPQFLIICLISFVLTIIRDSFNVWGVDFLKSIQTGKQALESAVGQSIGFDLGGAVSVLVIGVVYGRVRPEFRRWLFAGILLLLAYVVAALPGVGRSSPVAAAWLVAVVGLLLLGPYSLLTGVFAVESGGTVLAATASGMIDGVGYIGGYLSGSALGRLLDRGGYSLGFGCLAALTVVSALLALCLRMDTPTR